MIFGPKILNRFLMRRFLSSVALVLLVVCGIILAVTFVERLPSHATMGAALMDSWVRLLGYVPMFLPLAVFMGTLLASYNLTRSSENIIIAGAGRSPYQATRPFFWGAAVIGVLATTLLNPYSVRLSTRDITADKLQLVDDAIWIRETSDDGYITMTARGMHTGNDDLTFSDAVIYTQAPDYKMTSRVTADAVTLTDGAITAQNARIWKTGGDIRTGTFTMPTKLTPQTILERYLQPDQISFWRLPAFIKNLHTIGAPTRAYEIQFWTLLFLPLTMISMATLGVAFSQTRQRRNYSFGIKFSIGIITCFAVYFLINMFSAVATMGALPALLAIVAPPLIIIAGAGTFIASFDNV